MDKEQLRVMANFFRSFHGAASFADALQRARSLAENGELATAAVWNQIAEEISQIETGQIETGQIETGTKRRRKRKG